MTWLPAGATPLPRPDPQALARKHAARGDGLFAHNRFAEALNEFRQAAAYRPDDARLHYMLAMCADRSHQPQFVERHLLEALRLQPGAAPAHQAIAQWHVQHGREEQALHHSELAMSLAPNDPSYAIVRAIILYEVGRADEAWRLAEPLVRAGNHHPSLMALYATIAPKVGREAEAEPILERALQSREVKADPGHCADVHFHLGQMLDRRGEYDRAFAHFRAGNDIARLTRAPHDPVAHSRSTTETIRYFTRQRLARLPRAMHDDRRPVFIVGMPRSGTSLVEQILASHAEAFGAGELEALSLLSPALGPLVGAPPGEPYLAQFERLSVRAADQLAVRYLAHIDSLKPGNARYVTDKMPENFLRLDLVQLLFPNARVIHCVRDPLDTCLSCFTSHFETGNAHTFDLAHLGDYYADYRRLMSHWKRVLTVPIIDVRYEDLVLGPDAEIRRLLGFLDLPWDERCLRFHENKRKVKTASRDQVRRPIYTSSIGRWKHYEKHLGALMERLGVTVTPRVAA
jgi:Flp pilus assembly protein TadD